MAVLRMRGVFTGDELRGGSTRRRPHGRPAVRHSTRPCHRTRERRNNWRADYARLHRLLAVWRVSWYVPGHAT